MLAAHDTHRKSKRTFYAIPETTPENIIFQQSTWSFFLSPPLPHIAYTIHLFRSMITRIIVQPVLYWRNTISVEPVTTRATDHITPAV